MNRRPLQLSLVLWTAAAVFASAQDLGTLEQAAFRAAVARVAPSVVQIETIGGLERVDKLLFGTGPTTGLIVGPQGEVVSSAFNFVNRPTSILVRLPDGTRHPARLVATDHSRMLVLLKIDAPQPLPVPTIARQDEMRVGQWTIAVGRAFDVAQPNMAVGILSAVGRIWQKAIQTSAAVSPNNYGGPLVDIHGRVLGILVPLSPDSDSELAGADWYDSGIGFAIPAEHLMHVLPRLRHGEDLRPGVLGVGFHGRNLQSEPAVLTRVPPRSPADKAGLRPGDRIVTIDGRSVEHAAHVKEAISRRYAGDKLRLSILRNGKPLTVDVQLVDRLLPFQQPLLGVLPLRVAALAAEAGVGVRWVYPESPASKAGLRPGDHLLALAGKPIANRESLVEQLANLDVGAEVQLEFRRGATKQTAKLRLGPQPESLPPQQLPRARGEPRSPDKPAASAGHLAIRVGQGPGEVWAHVPPGYRPANAHGLLVWLQGENPLDPKELIARWAPFCQQHEVLLVVPKPAQGASWRGADVALLGRLIEDLQTSYTLDPSRIVVGGQQRGGSIALAAAARHRATIRGVIAVDAPLLGPPPESEPGQTLDYFLLKGNNRLIASLISQGVTQLRAQKLPVTEKAFGAADPLGSASLAEMLRWIDMLDRI
jgi:serine protease Do